MQYFATVIPEDSTQNNGQAHCMFSQIFLNKHLRIIPTKYYVIFMLEIDKKNWPF